MVKKRKKSQSNRPAVSNKSGSAPKNCYPKPTTSPRRGMGHELVADSTEAVVSESGFISTLSKSSYRTNPRDNHITTLIIGLVIGLLSLLLILTVTSIITLTLLFRHWWPVVNQVRQAANMTWSQVFQVVKQLSTVEPRQTSLNWLILGTDQLAERGENQPIFTDTIMLANIDPTTQTVTLLSVPRDVWLPDQAIKINTIYQHNSAKFNEQFQLEKRCRSHPTLASSHPVPIKSESGTSHSEINIDSEVLIPTLTEQHTKIANYCSELSTKINQLIRLQTQHDFAQVFDVPIDRLLIVDMKLVPQLIDALGGVRVNVETAFTDYSYPRSGVDVTVETDPHKLFETISFSAGPIQLDGQTALKYMRSRKAQNSEGSDLARAKRQQQVITALINQFMDDFPPQSIDQVLTYLKIYQDSLASQLTLAELLQVLLSLPGFPYSYSIKTATVPVIPIDTNGVLIESPRHYSGQWVFEMTSAKDFQEAIKIQLTEHDSENELSSFGNPGNSTPGPPPAPKQARIRHLIIWLLSHHLDQQ